LVGELKGSVSNPHTVFAPTNAAFDLAFPNGLDDLSKEEVESVLNYHMIFHGPDGRALKTEDLKEGSQVVVTMETLKELTINKAGAIVTVGSNSATVTTADVIASNGVVHIIDKVLDVPQDIVDKAIEYPVLSKFVAAVQKAELVSFLKGCCGNPHTVFAPSNAAFDLAFPKGLDDLSKEAVASILRYHIIRRSRLKTEDFEEGSQVVYTQEAGNGTWKELTINKAGATVTVGANSATVTTADVEAWNGVVHIVDKVVKETAFLTMI